MQNIMCFFTTLLKNAPMNVKQDHCGTQNKNNNDFMFDYEDDVLEITQRNGVEIVDFEWLSKDLVEKFNVIGYEKVWLLNNDFDLETGVIAWCKDYRISQSFTESLYLMYMFLNGHLLGSPLGHKVNYGYFAGMHDVLLQLCIRGVYIIEGVNQVIGKVPSQCAFMVLIRDEVMTPFIDVMECMYNKGINVHARRIKNRKVLLQYNKVKGYRTFENFKVDTSFICDRVTQVGGIGVCDGQISSDFSVWHVKVWNQDLYEDTCVEDMLLHVWVKFNSIYGFANYDMFVL